MLPTPNNYAVYPSVVPADKETELTVVPTERAFFFREGEEYCVRIIKIDTDLLSYYGYAKTAPSVNVIASGGVLRFSYVFAGEDAHILLLEQGERKLGELTVYSLFPDLLALTPLRGDLHSHTFRSDGKRDPAALLGHAREQGYDFLAITDHNRYYPGEEADEIYRDVKLGITRVRGEEVHVPGSPVHIVHVGGSYSVDDLYFRRREAFEKEILAYEQQVPAHIPEAFRTRYARAVWACEQIHKAGGLAIFPHPFWRPMGSRTHNVVREFASLLLTSGLFDAYELIGAMEQTENNCSVALWNDLRAEGLRIPVVASSDVHKLQDSPTFPHQFTVCFASSNTNEGIIEAIRSGNTVAVEATGSDYTRQYRAYGSHRLVRYAQYLLAHYFPRLARIAAGEGVAMRAYSMGEADPSLVERTAELTEQTRLRFLGKLPPVLPSPEMLAYEERWRKVQKDGPLTSGGSIDGTANRQL